MATTASAKRKQDEKHLKILREMVALPHNKTCFDCHQRGPTYVNMTIGSFICTSCSGILRGINPPHRVKSISMTSFTPDEMELLKSRGNQFCKKVWLARFNPSIHREPDSKDEHKVREYMSDKYEKKRYWTEATEDLHEEARAMNTPPTKPDAKSIRSLTGNSLPALKVQEQAPISIPKPVPAPTANAAPMNVAAAPAPPPTAVTTTTTNKPAALDLLSDLGGDPFAGPAKPPQQNSDVGGFADFSNFGSAAPAPAPQQAQAPAPSFPAPGPTPSTGLLQPMNSQSATAPAAPAAVPSSVGIQSASDKYAALASLDTVFGGGTTGNAGVNWDGSMMGGGGMGGGGSGMGWANSSAATSSSNFGAPSNSTAGFPSKQAVPEANPFGSVASTATTPGSNPFLVGGGGAMPPQAQPPSYNQVYGGAGGQTPVSGFVTVPPGSAPAARPQNGVFAAFPATSQQGFVGGGAGGMPGVQPPQQQPMQQVPGQFGANQAMPQGGQFAMNPAPQAVGNQQRPFATPWGGAQPTSNPFMAASVPNVAPPRATSTNPFL